MITRVFRPRVHPGKQADFERFLREVAQPFVASHAGLVSQSFGPLDPESTEFVYITVWQDLDALKGFAAERWQEAVIDAAERDMLAETWIGHYQAVEPG